jgi:uncharacterized protein (TIGR02594 family)
MKPTWIIEAEALIGTKEIKGAKHNPLIVAMWKWIKRGGIKDDETPWCAAFVGSCLEKAGIQSSRFESARSYLKFGMRLDYPRYGCIAVFERNGGGHVGFVVGKDDEGRLMILGGNQGDKVGIAPFEATRLLGYRWPEQVSIFDLQPIGIIQGEKNKVTLA